MPTGPENDHPLPRGYYLENERGVLVLRRPDGTAVAYFDGQQGLTKEAVEEALADYASACEEDR